MYKNEPQGGKYMDPNRNQPPKKPDGKRPKSSILITIMITVAIILLISTIYNAAVKSQYTQTTFSDFMDDAQKDNLAEVEIRYDRVLYMTKTEAAKPASQQKACFTGLPNGDALALAKELDAMGTTVNVQIVEDNSTIMMILYYVIMFGAIFGVMTLLSKKMGGGMMGNMGSSKAKVYMEKQTGVTFKDVAGQDEAK